MEGVTVQVLEANVYLLPNNRAGAFAEEGEIIIVRAGAYADSLVAAGALSYWTETPAVPMTAAAGDVSADGFAERVATVPAPPEAEIAAVSRKKRRGE